VIRLPVTCGTRQLSLSWIVVDPALVLMKSVFLGHSKLQVELELELIYSV
jgi:hypothetical protein